MRNRSNRILAKAIKEELSENRIKDDSFKPRERKLLKKVANKKLSPAIRRFYQKLNQERFNDFNKTDWLMYFQKLYKDANGIGYFINGQQMYVKHYGVINYLMKNYSANDIRSMIDFLFTSNQDLFPKGQITIYHLSSGFLPQVYQNTQLWIIGKYKPNKELKKRGTNRAREYDSSRDDEGDSIIL